MKRIQGEVKAYSVSQIEGIVGFKYKVLLKINGVFSVGVLTNKKNLCSIGDNVVVKYTEKFHNGTKYRNATEDTLTVMED